MFLSLIHFKKKTKTTIHIILCLGFLRVVSVMLSVCMIKVGKGSVAVVYPPDTYDNMDLPAGMAAAGGDQQYGQTPPDYSNGLEDCGFSDAVIRRGEECREQNVRGMFLFGWSELRSMNRIYSLIFFSVCS